MGIFCDSNQYNSSHVDIKPNKSEDAQMWEKYFTNIFNSGGDLYKGLKKSGFKRIGECSGIERYKKGRIIVVCGGHNSVIYNPVAFKI